MTSFRARIHPEHTDMPRHHVRVQVFAGPDEFRRGLAGELTLRLDEVTPFLDLVNGTGEGP